MSEWSRTSVVACLLLAACAGSETSGSAHHEPLKHRTSGPLCGVAPGPPLPADAGVPFTQCVTDADCRGGANGRCIQGRLDYCTYDACFSDKDCATGQLCECGSPTGVGNACLQSGCRVDADCPGSWCSPTFGTCGNYSGVIGYQCHTGADACTDDGDCGGTGTSGASYCMYDPMVGHWLCSNSQCAG